MTETLDGTDGAWRGEADDDWINYVKSDNLPKNTENRALWKSPVYCSVIGYSRHYPSGSSSDDEASSVYVMNVVMKDGRQWQVERTYDAWWNFKYSLPFWTCANFVNRFPLPRPFVDNSDSFLEYRRNRLGEWIRELVMDESCMASPIVLPLLYAFLDADSHGGAVSLENSRTNSRPFSIPCNLSIDLSSMGAITSTPLSLTAMQGLLPFQVPIQLKILRYNMTPRNIPWLFRNDFPPKNRYLLILLNLPFFVNCRCVRHYFINQHNCQVMQHLKMLAIVN